MSEALTESLKRISELQYTRCGEWCNCAAIEALRRINEGNDKPWLTDLLWRLEGLESVLYRSGMRKESQSVRDAITQLCTILLEPVPEPVSTIIDDD